MDAEERKRARRLAKLTAPCPRCGKVAHGEGEMFFGEASMVIYSCEDCADSVAVETEFFEMAVSFVVNARGESVEVDKM